MVDSTNEFLDYLSKSELVQNLFYYKNKVIQNKDVMSMLSLIEETSNDTDIINIRKKLYDNTDYSFYMKYYSELMDIVRDINNFYKNIFNRCGDELL